MTWWATASSCSRVNTGWAASGQDSRGTEPIRAELHAESPVMRRATSVSTSTGLVTGTSSASGATCCRVGGRVRRIPMFASARSSRVWPGFCLAPADRRGPTAGLVRPG